MLSSIKKSISSVYLLYELNTCIYMLDPWEKKFINGVIFSILALLIFSSYVYLPSYTRKLINAFMPTGNELTLDLMDSHHHQQPVDYSVN
ncbi:AAEL005048-PB [Aedes aegypti]|uniref:AAEL005048-PA n=1 Tax=Aedes aegypti TaxID=7159 RepID=Q17B82_AEDAE|nr:AAEL005048-PA [Aedes aegypti]EJY57564.1 AAEL005048-PB [Aedes aegypti]